MVTINYHMTHVYYHGYRKLLHETCIAMVIDNYHMTRVLSWLQITIT